MLRIYSYYAILSCRVISCHIMSCHVLVELQIHEGVSYYKCIVMSETNKLAHSTIQYILRYLIHVLCQVVRTLHQIVTVTTRLLPPSVISTSLIIPS